mgnify:CR=1 FL=1
MAEFFNRKEEVIFFEFILLKQFNYNELFLKYFYYFIIIFSPAYGAIAPFIFMFAPYIFMKYVLKVPVPSEKIESDPDS